MIDSRARNVNGEVHIPTVNLVAGVIGQPQEFVWEHGNSAHRLLFSCRGSALATDSAGQTAMLSPGSALLVPRGSECRVLLGRGTQEWLSAEWSAESNAVAFTALKSPTASRYGAWYDPARGLALQETTEMIRQSIEESEVDPSLSIAWTNLVSMKLEPDANGFSLAEVPANINESLMALIEAIKTEPEKQWSLSEAATLAGYSPFHLSRVFRSTTEVGFPEYVDRCRTEVAVQHLLESDRALAEVAEIAGFGSPQAMRGALREYTGFLPSEIRNQADTG